MSNPRPPKNPVTLSPEEIGVRVDLIRDTGYMVSLTVPVNKLNIASATIAVLVTPPKQIMGTGEYPAEDLLLGKAYAVGSAMALAPLLAPAILKKLDSIRKTNDILNRAAKGEKDAQDLLREGSEDLAVGMAFYRPELMALGGEE